MSDIKTTIKLLKEVDTGEDSERKETWEVSEPVKFRVVVDVPVD